MCLGWVGRGVGCLALLATLAAGCVDDDIDPPVDRDGGLEPDPPRILELETAPSLALGFQESVEFEVRYTELDGTAIADATVTFALEGSAHDSTLDDLEATTMADGRARGTLTSGSTAAVFRIRATASRASPVFIDVSVSDVGFGDLRVIVHDGVEGRDVDRFVAQLYPELSCDDAELDDALPAREVVVRSDLEALLPSLPADFTYAVVVRAEGAAGGLLGWGCADTGVEADAETEVDVDVMAVPLTVEGMYEATLELETPDSAATAADAVEAAGLAHVDAAGGDAHVLLDGIQAYLDDHPELDGEFFATQRELMEPGLTDALNADGTGAEGTVPDMADALQGLLAGMRIVGPLRLDPMADEGGDPAAWTLDHAEMDHPDTGDPVQVPVTGASGHLALALHLDRDAVDLQALELDLELGRLAESALWALVTEGDPAVPVAWVQESIGCDTLEQWVQDDGTVFGLCDVGCARWACTYAALVLVTEAGMGARALDASRERMTFDVPALDGTLTDTTGDGAVDALAIPGLSGLWTTEGGTVGDSLSGGLDATRTGDLP
jgi:hypothetical protein